ncbi:MAG: hypothetical protein LBC97_07010 [Bifidobacteriaceae bacterium]|jgi:toxin-antitoxin system PIN domain toxin|nr:hypothetical protein [Bifidobacteriaceae bacterium]
MAVLLDVSALIALLDPDHASHQTVNDWMAINSLERWASCPITENGYVRIVSQPSYPHPLTIGLALAALTAARNSPRHEFWPCDISVADAQRVDTSLVLGPAQVTDTYLLALAVARRGRFVTLDRRASLAAVPGATRTSVVLLA